MFQYLLGKHLSGRNARAVWIDTGNEASTYQLERFGDPGILEKVRIGRAFTAFQHHSLVREVCEGFEEEFLALTNVNHLYVDGQLKHWEAEELFSETLERIEEVSETSKVLVSCRSACDQLMERANNVVDLERTREGLRHGSERKIYGNGQTTVSNWC